ncbi:MAG: Nramp family divalent metal transporter [Candidatus Babeliales bacterium]
MILLKNLKTNFVKLTKNLGPGFVTGASDNDPSGIGTYSIAGAQYGLLCLWLIPFLLPFMIAIQEMCSRIGVVTRKGLTANIKENFPKPILYCAVLILLFANIFNIGANLAIMAEAIKLLFGGKLIFWMIFLTLTITFMEIFIRYRDYSRILVFFSLFLLVYVATAFTVNQNWLDIFKFTFFPKFNFSKGFIFVATGFIGTTISPYLFFWQPSQEIEDLNDDNNLKNLENLKKTIKKKRTKTAIGMAFSQIITFFIIITCFSTLHKNGITKIENAAQAASALKPLAGDFAFIFFTLGILGAGFLGVSVLAGSAAYALAETFNFKQGLSYKFREAKFFYSIIAVSTFIGFFINFIGINPIKALFYAAIINGISTVPFIIIILILANKKKVMAEYKNKFISNFLGIATFFLMFLSALLIFWQIIF